MRGQHGSATAPGPSTQHCHVLDGCSRYSHSLLAGGPDIQCCPRPSHCSISDSCLQLPAGEGELHTRPNQRLCVSSLSSCCVSLQPLFKSTNMVLVACKGVQRDVDHQSCLRQGLASLPPLPLLASLLGCSDKSLPVCRGKRHLMSSQTVPLWCPAQPTATTHPITTSTTGAATSQRSPAFSRERASTWTTTASSSCR